MGEWCVTPPTRKQTRDTPGFDERERKDRRAVTQEEINRGMIEQALDEINQARVLL